MNRVFIVDDDKNVLDTLSIMLKAMNVYVEGYYDPIEGLEKANENSFDLYIADLLMPKINGADFTKQLLSTKPQAKILIITGDTTHQLARKALKNGAVSLVGKPFQISKIMSFLKG